MLALSCLLLFPSMLTYYILNALYNWQLCCTKAFNKEFIYLLNYVALKYLFGNHNLNIAPYFWQIPKDEVKDEIAEPLGCIKNEDDSESLFTMVSCRIYL